MPVYTYTTIDDPRANFSTDPTAINDAGTIVGTYADLAGNHGFLYSGGTYTTLDAPGPSRPAHRASTRRASSSEITRTPAVPTGSSIATAVTRPSTILWPPLSPLPEASTPQGRSSATITMPPASTAFS
jgi:probable HAF family extracellular repeat protein